MINVESDVLDFYEIGLRRARLTIEGINDEGETWKLEVGNLQIEGPEQIRFTIDSHIESITADGEVLSTNRKDYLKLIIDTVEMQPDLSLDNQKLKVTTSEELPHGQG